MRSLYLSGLGRNSSLISSLTSLELRNIYLEIIINKRFLFKGRRREELEVMVSREIICIYLLLFY